VEGWGGRLSVPGCCLSLWPKRRSAPSDPRLSLEERYLSREDYLQQVRTAAQMLVDHGYLLAEDLSWVEEGAARRYEPVSWHNQRCVEQLPILLLLTLS